MKVKYYRFTIKYTKTRNKLNKEKINELNGHYCNNKIN